MFPLLPVPREWKHFGPTKFYLGRFFFVSSGSRETLTTVTCHLGIQGTAAALVRSARAAGGVDAAQEVANRIFAWGMMLGVVLALVQWFALPSITWWFSPLTTVWDAVRGPAAISLFIHLVNGLLVFAVEGTMLGLGSYRDLALIMCLGVFVMVLCLSSSLGVH